MVVPQTVESQAAFSENSSGMIDFPKLVRLMVMKRIGTFATAGHRSTKARITVSLTARTISVTGQSPSAAEACYPAGVAVYPAAARVYSDCAQTPAAAAPISAMIERTLATVARTSSASARIWVDRGTGTFAFLAIDTVPDYTWTPPRCPPPERAPLGNTKRSIAFTTNKSANGAVSSA